jgi:hypothetical protein
MLLRTGPDHLLILDRADLRATGQRPHEGHLGFSLLKVEIRNELVDGVWWHSFKKRLVVRVVAYFNAGRPDHHVVKFAVVNSWRKIHFNLNTANDRASELTRLQSGGCGVRHPGWLPICYVVKL